MLKLYRDTCNFELSVCKLNQNEADEAVEEELEYLEGHEDAEDGVVSDGANGDECGEEADRHGRVLQRLVRLVRHVKKPVFVNVEALNEEETGEKKCVYDLERLVVSHNPKHFLIIPWTYH